MFINFVFVEKVQFEKRVESYSLSCFIFFPLKKKMIPLSGSDDNSKFVSPNKQALKISAAHSHHDKEEEGFKLV